MHTTFRLQGRHGRPILGDLDRPADAGAPIAPVVIVHGFKGFKDWGFFPWVARQLAAAGMLAVRFNMSHNGVGEDLVDFSDLEGFAQDSYGVQLDDLTVVLEALAAGQLGERAGVAVAPDVSLLGHSRGGGVALLGAAEHRQVTRVATWSAISTVMRYDDETLRHWKEAGRIHVENARTKQQMPLDYRLVSEVLADPARFDILAAVRRLAIPRLFVHGTEDASVPVAEADALLAAALESPAPTATLFRVDGAGHTFDAVHPFAGPTPALKAAMARTLEFLKSAAAD